MPPTIAPTNLTDRHTQILKLLYRFRFLTRPQIQQMINHKSNSRLSLWLKQLTNDAFCCRYYSRSMNAQAAIYSLGANGRKYLLRSNDPSITKRILNRVWREQSLSLQSKKHHLLIADLYLAVSTLALNHQAELSYSTKTDLCNYQHLIRPTPDAYFVLTENSGLTNRFLSKSSMTFLPGNASSNWSSTTSPITPKAPGRPMLKSPFPTSYSSPRMPEPPKCSTDSFSTN
jgi:hypothetical protein